jgi:hypothetical protein
VNLFRPREAGEGDRAFARWKGRRPRRFFRDDNEAPSQTPTPPCFAWSPSPAIAVADKRYRSRDASAPESCLRHSQRTPSEHDPVRLGRRWHRLPSRPCSSNKKGSGTPAGAVVHPPRHTARLARSVARSPVGVPPRRLRGAATERYRSAPASWDGLRRSGRYPPLPPQCSGSPRRPVTVPAGRFYPEPPGSGGDEPPPAGTALAPPTGVAAWRPLRERDSLNVTATVTDVRVVSLL